MTKRPHTYGSTGPRKPTTIDLDATQVRVEEAVDAAKEGAAAAVSDQLAPAPAVDEAPKDPVAADGVSDTAVMADVAADPGRDQATQVEGTTQAQGAITPAWAARGEEPAPEATATETANDPSPAEAMSATAAADTAQHASTSPADADPKASDSIDPVEDVARPAATETPAVDEPVVAATKPVEPAPAAAASPAPVAAPPRKSSAGAVFAGALGGGILGTAAAYVVATLGFWPAAGPVPADPAALQRIAGLEQELKALAARPTPAAPTGQIDALAASLKALEGQIANLPKPADPTTAVAAVTTRIEALDAAVKAAAERADAATRDLEALRKAIAEAPAGAAGETSPAALTALNQAVAELSTKLEETRQSIGGVSSTVIDGLKADLEAAKTAAATQAEAAKAAADAALKEARDRAAALEAAVKDVAGQAGPPRRARSTTSRKTSAR
jgi:trimeric autotransporter adhesin